MGRRRRSRRSCLSCHAVATIRALSTTDRRPARLRLAGGAGHDGRDRGVRRPGGPDGFDDLVAICQIGGGGSRRARGHGRCSSPAAAPSMVAPTTTPTTSWPTPCRARAVRPFGGVRHELSLRPARRSSCWTSAPPRLPVRIRRTRDQSQGWWHSAAGAPPRWGGGTRSARRSWASRPHPSGASPSPEGSWCPAGRGLLVSAWRWASRSWPSVEQRA